MTVPARRRTSRRPDPRSVVGHAGDLELLGALAWAGVLSTSQFQRLRGHARRRAQRRLRALFDHGLVRVHLQGDALERENVYTLSPQGLDLLVERGAFPDGPPPLARAPAPGKLRHTLLTRQVFVELKRAETDGLLALDDYRFDGELAREPLLRAHGIIPDGLALVRTGALAETWLVEVDVGTETTTVLRDKFGKYARAFAAGQGLFGSAPTFLLVLATRPGRLETLATIVAAAGLAPRTRLLVLDALGPWLAAGWAQGVGARGGRAERPALFTETTSFQVNQAGDEAAFRPRGAGAR